MRGCVGGYSRASATHHEQRTDDGDMNSAAQRAGIEPSLPQFGQQHLFDFWEELSEPQRERLIGDVQRIDFGRIARLMPASGGGESKPGASHSEDWASLARRAQPPVAFRLDGQGNEFSADAARAAGEAALARGEVGAILVAGG